MSQSPADKDRRPSSKPDDRRQERRSEQEREFDPHRHGQVTVPIAPEDLDVLVEATAAPERVGGRSTAETLSVGSSRRAAAEMTADEEFGASGASISEAVTSVTNQYAAVSAPGDSDRSAAGNAANAVHVAPRPASEAPTGTTPTATPMVQPDDDIWGDLDEELSPQQAALRVGELNRVPVVCVSQHEITRHKLDHHQGFVLSQVDGVLSYNEIIAVSGMHRTEALRTLARLLELNLIKPQ